MHNSHFYPLLVLQFSDKLLQEKCFITSDSYAAFCLASTQWNEELMFLPWNSSVVLEWLELFHTLQSYFCTSPKNKDIKIVRLVFFRMNSIFTFYNEVFTALFTFTFHLKYTQILLTYRSYIAKEILSTQIFKTGYESPDFDYIRENTITLLFYC